MLKRGRLSACGVTLGLWRYTGWLGGTRRACGGKLGAWVPLVVHRVPMACLKKALLALAKV